MQKYFEEETTNVCDVKLTEVNKKKHLIKNAFQNNINAQNI